MSKWFRISNYSDGIDEVDVVRETEKQLITKGLNGFEYRVAKRSVDINYYKTEKEAVTEKIKQLRDREESCLETYQKAEFAKRDFVHKYFDKYPDVV